MGTSSKKQPSSSSYPFRLHHHHQHPTPHQLLLQAAMARTKQTARQSTGGKAPRRQLATKAVRGFKSYMRSQQSVGRATSSMPGRGGRQSKHTSFINFENTMGRFRFPCGAPAEDSEIFRPNFSTTTSVDPTTGNTEHWLGVHFVSNLDDDGMRRLGRPPVEIIFSLDISGSMSCAFANDGEFRWGVAQDVASSKLGVAVRCVKSMIQQLGKDDAFGVSCFNHQQHTVLPLTRVSKMNLKTVMQKLDRLVTSGGTDLASGFSHAMSMLPTSAGRKNGEKSKNQKSRTGPSMRRVIFLTDMESSVDDEEDVLAIALKSAKPKKAGALACHTSVIGVGVDISVSSVEALSRIPGCKYASVASASEFEESVAAEFAFDITPVAFDINVSLPSSSAFRFVRGYGSPEVNDLSTAKKSGGKNKQASGGGHTSFQLSSEFPTIADPDRQASGALIAFKLQENNADHGGGGANSTGKSKKSPPSVELTTSYRDLGGTKYSNTQVVKLGGSCNEPGALGVRKAVALIRYVDLQAAYVAEDDDEDDDHASQPAPPGVLSQRYRPMGGGSAAAPLTVAQIDQRLSKHRQWVKKFSEFRVWLLAEMKACGDDTLRANGGSNHNVLQTVKQIEDLEKKEVADLEARRAVAHAADVAAASAAASVSTAGKALQSGDAGADIPSEYLCPITAALMQDPVIAADGHSYERSAIERWFSEASNYMRIGGRGTARSCRSPMTNLPLDNNNLVTNRALKILIRDFCSKKDKAKKGANGASADKTAVSKRSTEKKPQKRKITPAANDSSSRKRKSQTDERSASSQPTRRSSRLQNRGAAPAPPPAKKQRNEKAVKTKSGNKKQTTQCVAVAAEKDVPKLEDQEDIDTKDGESGEKKRSSCCIM